MDFLFKLIKKIIIFFGVLFIVVIIIGMMSDDESVSNNSSSSTTSNHNNKSSKLYKMTHKEQEQHKAKPMSLRKIITDYNNNEVRADNLYQDRTFIISGYVTDISKDFLDNMYVTLYYKRDKYVFDGLRASFPDNSKYNNYLSKLSRGQKIKLHCTINGLSIGSVMADCVN